MRSLWHAISDQRWEDARALIHPELVVEWPQTRERFRGPEDFIEGGGRLRIS